MATLNWEKARSKDYLKFATQYEQESKKREKLDRKQALEGKRPTKLQMQRISQLRRERDYVVKMYPNTRRKASQLIRELEAAPKRRS